jgi:hypothetical protein
LLGQMMSHSKDSIYFQIVFEKDLANVHSHKADIKMWVALVFLFIWLQNALYTFGLFTK